MDVKSQNFCILMFHFSNFQFSSTQLSVAYEFTELTIVRTIFESSEHIVNYILCRAVSMVIFYDSNEQYKKTSNSVI